jgi:prepilin peptidase CpaA
MAWFGNTLIAGTVGLLAWAAVTDIALRIVPDTVCVLVALLGIAGRAAAGLTELAVSLALGMMVFAVLAAARARGWLGGGDVKLAAATAAISRCTDGQKTQINASIFRSVRDM